jgi:hypothetical protein
VLRLVVPFVAGMLHPRLRVLVTSLGGEFRQLRNDGGHEDDYWNLFAELWSGPDDFLLVEQDVLPALELLGAMASCKADWCAGHGGGALGRPLLPQWQCRLGPRPAPCGGKWEPPRLCAWGDPHSIAVNFRGEHPPGWQNCPWRSAGKLLVRSDAWLACNRFGAIRQQIPDLMVRAHRHRPSHHWMLLDGAVFDVLQGEELREPHLHWPPLQHRPV